MKHKNIKIKATHYAEYIRNNGDTKRNLMLYKNKSNTNNYNTQNHSKYTLTGRQAGKLTRKTYIQQNYLPENIWELHVREFS